MLTNVFTLSWLPFMLSVRIKFAILAVVAPVQLQTLKVTAWRHYIR